MGVFLLIAMVIAIVTVPIICAIRCCKQGSKVRSLFLSLKKKILWNTVIRSILLAYLKTIISCLKAVVLLSFATGLQTLNAIIALVLSVVLVAMPAFFMWLLCKNQGRLSRTALKERYESLYLGIRTSHAWEYAYSTVFLYRRLIYAVITVTCLSNPNISIHTFLASNLIYIVYFGLSQPHDTILARRIEYFNEIGLQLTTYHLALFPLTLTIKGEEMLGWSMIGFVCAIFFVNMIIIVIVTLLVLKRKMYLKKLKKGHTAKMEEMQERRKKQYLLDQSQASAQKLVRDSSSILSSIVEEEDSSSSSSSNSSARSDDQSVEEQSQRQRESDISQSSLQLSSRCENADFTNNVTRNIPNISTISYVASPPRGREEATDPNAKIVDNAATMKVEIKQEAKIENLVKKYLERNEPIEAMVKRIEKDFFGSVLERDDKTKSEKVKEESKEEKKQAPTIVIKMKNSSPFSSAF